MVKASLITLFTLVIAFVVIYAIWTARVAKQHSDNILDEFKKIDSSLKRSNDRLQDKTARLPELELSIRAGAISSCIDSMKHELVELSKQDNTGSFSYPDTAGLLRLKNNLAAFNSFIQKHFANHPGISADDFINVSDVQGVNASTTWEKYYFTNSSIFGMITELTFINNRVSKLKQKAMR